MSPVDPRKLQAFAGGPDEDTKPDGIPVPMLQQETDFSCGPAALLAVLQFYGLDEGATEQDLYGALGTTPKDGTNAQELADVAGEYGLAANWRTGVTVDDLRDAVDAGVPVILNFQAWEDEPDEPRQHMEDGHYVVLVAVRDDEVEYMDPSTGGYETMSVAELVKRWHDVEGSRGAIFVGRPEEGEDV